MKISKVIGNQVILRDATKDDAEFIVALRTDPQLGRYISPTSEDVALQVEWLTTYASDDSQIYFIIEDKNGERFGTVRIYDQRGDSFCWGSWILKKERPSGFAMESALMVYHLGLRLGFTKSHFDVRKENRKVWQFHERFGAERIGETDKDYLYEISHNSIKTAIGRFQDFLPNGIEVVNA